MKFVYIVERTDYDHHTTEEGKMAVVSIHTTLAGANEAAKTHMQDELRNATVTARHTSTRVLTDLAGLRAM